MEPSSQAPRITFDRSTLKRLAPPALKGLFDRVRDRLNGPGIEYAVLNDNVFRADPDPRPRINLVIPDLSHASAFGGVMTGLSFFNDLVGLLKPAGIDARIVTEKPVETGDNAASHYPALKGCDIHSLKQNSFVLPTRNRDLFVAFNWWTSLNLEPALREQARFFGRPPMPKLQLIQEYEPGFYPFSAAHLLSREAMGGQWPIWAIINSRELREFWVDQGHRAEREYLFEPRMNGRLRPFVENISPEEKERIVLVYGRPQILRNAFYLVRRSLEIWAASHGHAHGGWRFISAGESHDDIDIGAGHRLVSLGKVSLDDYARLLRKTAVGLSLMVSPHPSYPPLEMAHFGARVVTNSYPKKRPEQLHENLVTFPGPRPEEIAQALEREIARFEADPAAGLRAKTGMPSYLCEDRVECVDAIAEDVVRLLLARPAAESETLRREARPAIVQPPETPARQCASATGGYKVI